MIENKRRDELIERLANQMITNSGAAPAQPADHPIVPEHSQGLCVFPEILRNIGNFDETHSKAVLWLDTLNCAQTLHQIPDSYMLEITRMRLVEGAKY
ncbi:unnamed protein product [Ceutorhynchus assimilis]|uniref:Uncharacterized protein n=1 Tax=Ceutorhynchus assimilis TaxID=467358 RepID=A0A9N9MSL0_9CUCU|nr:unnamed protein product [Ceutorhynchus assimilis]